MEESQAGSSSASSSVKKRRKFAARIPPCRVKKVLQTDEEVGRMTASVPVVLGRAMEHFAERLVKAAAATAREAEARTLGLKHIHSTIQSQKDEFGLLSRLITDSPIMERQSSSSSSASTPSSGGSIDTPSSAGKGGSNPFLFPPAEKSPEEAAKPKRGRPKKRKEETAVKEEPFVVPGAPPLKRARSKDEQKIPSVA